MLEVLANNIIVLQIVILSVVGSLVGELFRNVQCMTGFTLLRAIADFLASALFAVMFGLTCYRAVTQDKVVLSIVSLYMGFMGYSVSSKYASKIWDAVLKTILENKTGKKGKGD